jgi:hypothetical protein
LPSDGSQSAAAGAGTRGSSLKSAYEAWNASRADFNVRLAALEVAAVEEGWQRHYLRGEAPTGERPDFHVSKRKLRMPHLDKER